MPEGTNTPAESGASTSQQPGAPAIPNTANGATPPAPGGTEQAVSNPEAKRYADEAAAERKARKALEAELKKFQDAQLSDLEKLQKQHEAVSKQAEAYKARIAAMSVEREAQKLGIVDPEVAAALIAARLEYDAETGAPTNAAKLLEQLAKDKPYLVAAAAPAAAGQPGAPTAPPLTAGGATNPSRSATGGGAKIPLSWDYIDQLAQSNTQEYLSRHAEIQAWMLANVRSRPRR